MPKYSEYLLLMLLVWLVPEIAYAQVLPQTPATNSSVANVLCGVVQVIQGPVGSGIAVLGVISIGLISMFGKIQVSSLLTVLTGIAIIFGAPGMLTKLIPGFQLCDTSTAVGLSPDIFTGLLGCIIGWFIGPVGKVVATLALVLVGIFATYGRVSWHQAMLVAVGIATMFGSVTIVSTLVVPVAGGTATITSACAGGVDSFISISQIFCNLYGWFLGTTGKGIATIGMLILGVGALFGKVSWGIASVCAIGVGLIFGADSIIMALGAQEGAAGCTSGDLI